MLLGVVVVVFFGATEIFEDLYQWVLGGSGLRSGHSHDLIATLMGVVRNRTSGSTHLSVICNESAEL